MNIVGEVFLYTLNKLEKYTAEDYIQRDCIGSDDGRYTKVNSSTSHHFIDATVVNGSFYQAHLCIKHQRI